MTGRPDDNLRGFDQTHRGGADRPLTGLLTELAQETTTLVRKEVELAKAEVSEKVSQATTGAVSLATGGSVFPDLLMTSPDFPGPARAYASPCRGKSAGSVKG